MQASPSKARAQALESHSWSLVTSWLSNLYHPRPIPPFERNAATLKALQSLMAENAAADRLRELVHDAQCEELKEARTQTAVAAAADNIEADSAGELLSLLESSLSGPAASALDSLARSAVLLGCSSTSPTAPRSIGQVLQSKILGLSQEIVALESQIRSLDRQISRFQTQRQQEQEQGQSHIQQPLSTPTEDHTHTDHPFHPDDPSAHPPNPITSDYSSLHAQTLQQQREMKQLEFKSQEYRDRIAQLTRQLEQSQTSRSGLTIADLVAKQERLLKRKKELDALETTIHAFHGLPPDVQVSREEVRRATAELELLRRRRDEVFERMGGAWPEVTMK